MSGDSSALKKLTDSKLTTFALGQVKKSRFQREREEKELKKKQDEEEAAKIYESFVESFEGDSYPSHNRHGDEHRKNGGSGMKVFVKGGRDRADSDLPSSLPISSSSNKTKPFGRDMDLFKDEAQV